MVPVVDAYMPVYGGACSVRNYLDSIKPTYPLKTLAIHLCPSAQSSHYQDLLRLDESAKRKGSGGFPQSLLASVQCTTEFNSISSSLHSYLDKPITRMRGIHLLFQHSLYKKATLSRILTEFDNLMPVNWVVDVEADIGNFGDVATLVDQYPHRKFVLSFILKPNMLQHYNESVLTKEIEKIAHFDNVYFKFAFALTVSSENNREIYLSFLECFFHSIDSARMMFGTGNADAAREYDAERMANTFCVQKSEEISQRWNFIVGLCNTYNSEVRENLLRLTAMRVYEIEA